MPLPCYIAQIAKKGQIARESNQIKYILLLYFRCFIDLRTFAGQKYSQSIFVLEIFCFGVISLSYGAIWMKIKRSAKTTSSKVTDSKIERHKRSARVMLLFLLVFIFQWWPMILLNVWEMFTISPSFFPIITGSIVNLGGVFNCIVYTIIRKRFQHQVAPEPQI